MAKKVNTDAVVAAVIRVNSLYHEARCEQYKSIIYIKPGVHDFDVERIVGISLRPTGRWNEATVTGPACTDQYPHLRLIVSVDNLLPEFIIEGETVPEDEE